MYNVLLNAADPAVFGSGPAIPSSLQGQTSFGVKAHGAL